jgi:putative transcriptional regulator
LKGLSPKLRLAKQKKIIKFSQKYTTLCKLQLTFCNFYITIIIKGFFLWETLFINISELKKIMSEREVLKNRLKVWRAEKNITQQELAKAVCLSRQTINAIEKGKFAPSIVSVLKIAIFFNTDVENIFYFEETTQLLNGKPGGRKNEQR